MESDSSQDSGRVQGIKERLSESRPIPKKEVKEKREEMMKEV